MAWLDDRIWAHPKLSRVPRATRWTYVAALAYSSGFGLYGRLNAGHLKTIGCTAKQRRELVDVGLWHDVPDLPGTIEIHDWDEHNGQRDAALEQRRLADRRRQAVKRSPELRAIVRKRDADLCRYCGKTVDFSDRKSPTGGTYDHVDPKGDNSPENVVVSCRSDNSRKGDRTPEQAGMRLLPPGTRSRSDQGRDLEQTQMQDQGRDLDSEPDVLAPARAGAPLMTSDEVTRTRTPAGPTTSTQDHDHGLPFEQQVTLARVMAFIADDADDGTRHIVATFVRDLPESAIAKALESAEHATPDDRAAYIIGALTSETNERNDPEPAPSAGSAVGVPRG